MAGLAVLEGPWGAEHLLLLTAAAASAASCLGRTRLPCEACGKEEGLTWQAGPREEEGHREGHAGPGGSGHREGHREGHTGPGSSGHREGHTGPGGSRPALSSRQEPTGLAEGGTGAAVQPISHLGGHINGFDWGFRVINCGAKCTAEEGLCEFTYSLSPLPCTRCLLVAQHCVRAVGALLALSPPEHSLLIPLWCSQTLCPHVGVA